MDSLDVKAIQIGYLIFKARTERLFACVSRLVVESFVAGSDFIALVTGECNLLAFDEHAIFSLILDNLVFCWRRWNQKDLVFKGRWLLRRHQIPNELGLEIKVF